MRAVNGNIPFSHPCLESFSPSSPMQTSRTSSAFAAAHGMTISTWATTLILILCYLSCICISHAQSASPDFSPGEYRSATVTLKLETKDGKSATGHGEVDGKPFAFTGAIQDGVLQAKPDNDTKSLSFSLSQHGNDLIFIAGERTERLKPQPSAQASAPAKPALRITADKSSYKHGEVMKVTVEIPHEGFLRIYGVSTNGSTVLLFPNKWSQGDKVAKGTLVLPATDAAYDFMLTLDEGQTRVSESLHAVFSTTPFTDSGSGKISFGESKFEGLGVTNSEQRSTRGLTPTARATATSVEAKYELNR